ncbi:hypothetical protein ACHAQA_004142 [Verticillium albo-atrum]
MGFPAPPFPESDDPADRDLPSYTGPELSEKTFEVQAVSGSAPPPPQTAPSVPRSVPRSVPTAGLYPVQPPPYYPLDGKPTKGFIPPPQVPKPKPLRLVRLSRKRKPPVLYTSSTHTLIQSLTTLTFAQPKTPLSPPPAYYDTNETAHPTLRKRTSAAPPPAKMASNPNMPKVSTSSPPMPPSGPFQNSGPRPAPNAKEDLLADLRRQLDDSASDAASSVDSRGRRRRRSRNNKALAAKGQGGPVGASGLQGPGIMPRLAETKPVRLQLGLNLDVEVELKARLQGDVSLTLL